MIHEHIRYYKKKLLKNVNIIKYYSLKMTQVRTHEFKRVKETKSRR